MLDGFTSMGFSISDDHLYRLLGEPMLLDEAWSACSLSVNPLLTQ